MRCAKKNNIKIINLEEAYNIENLLFISLEFDRIIKPSNFLTSRLFNIHFSLLPKYKGVYTSIMPILFGEAKSGVSLHRIDEGIDTGAIIAQKSFKIDINDSARDLYFKYLKNDFLLFKANIDKLIGNNFIAIPQNNLESTYFSRKEIDLNFEINFNKTSFQIHNQIRAFIFREYQLPKIKDNRICQSILTNEFVGKRVFEEYENRFEISGIDGFRVVCYKSMD
ncbi:formyltransferase family protein [Helicobacter burdigaliensis]|uniref:formyltransferase family protein n=1 Tax=Helicobacter burdigaliensis TaxID=2315334 RepID=UPI001E4F3BFD|nr:formyltransferase family protein [Helicobacter burdigaliensis]